MFDPKLVEVEKLSTTEIDEFLKSILSLDLVEIYDYIYFILNEKYLLSDNSPVCKAYESFLRKPEFKSYRDAIMSIVDEEEYESDKEISRKDYLASNIAYLKQMISDCHDISEPTGYEKEIEDLKNFEIEYKTL